MAMGIHSSIGNLIAPEQCLLNCIVKGLELGLVKAIEVGMLHRS
jgi:hypothetical protein